MARTYIAIDLKSFYASTECVKHGWNPLDINLVVADKTRTAKTICLAVSPALKAFGIPGRPRLFEVEQAVKDLNYQRVQQAPYRHLSGKSCNRKELLSDPSKRLDYKVVRPRMALYLRESARIYEIYLRFVPAEKIHVYSIDEVFIDATDYLKDRQEDAYTMARQIVSQIAAETGITATAGIGTNLFLAKVAMDIVAKHIPADRDGVRIAQLDEQRYRKYLWAHQPLTDFWRIGRGYAKRLARLGLHTMGDIARCSLGSLSDKYNPDLLFAEFGKNAELLMDHAWGREPVTMADIKNYRPAEHGLSSSQVLMRPYTYAEGRLIAREMVDALVLDLVKKDLATSEIGLYLSYDPRSLEMPGVDYDGPLAVDFYGRLKPKSTHSKADLPFPTAAISDLSAAIMKLYQQAAVPRLLIRRVTVTFNRLRPLYSQEQPAGIQLDLFADRKESEKAASRRKQDYQVQKVILKLRHRLGQNAIFHAADLLKGATAIQRNNQIGGHRA